MTTLQLHVVDVVERAVKTFVETFVVAWGLTGYSLSKVALGGALASALSVIWNVTSKVANATSPSNQ